MTPDDPLLKILACPLDKGPLRLLPEGALYNPRLRRRYPIVDGVPQLLPSSGEQLSEEEHEELLARIGTGGDDADEGGGGTGSAAVDTVTTGVVYEAPSPAPGTAP